MDRTVCATLLTWFALVGCGEDAEKQDTGSSATSTSESTTTGTSGSQGSTTATTGSSSTTSTSPTTEDISACLDPSTELLGVGEELTVNGVARTYRVTVPARDAGVPLPVLFAFHGGDEGHFGFPQQSLFDRLADEQGAILIYPHAKLVDPNEGAWQLNTSEGYTQDTEFVEAMIDELRSRYCVDLKRLYATGYSLGSMFTYELPCHMSGRFAAVASHAGTMPVVPYSCDMEDPVAVMHLHGRSDWIIDYNEPWDWKEWDYVGTMMDVPSLVDFWGDKNTCASVDEAVSSGFMHITHDDCDGAVRVEHYALDGQGHDWPMSVDGVSTHQLIWDFVSGFSKP